MAAITHASVAAALDYAARGWRVVPLYGLTDTGCECAKGDACDSPGKHPRLIAWQKKATIDVDEIKAWWQKWPGSNVGVALGKESGLIDIECDTPEAEQELLALFGGDFPVVPTFQSSRGKHRLFKWRMGFPNEATKKLGTIDIKLGSGSKGSQSVFPPSRHASGEMYRWLVTPEDADPGDIPDSFVAACMRRWFGGGQVAGTNGHAKPDESDPLWMNRDPGDRPPSKRLGLYTPEGIGDGERDNAIYAEACEQWRLQMAGYGGRRVLDEPERQAAVTAILWNFNLARCRPPLDAATVQAKMESARSFHRTQGGDRTVALSSLGLERIDGEWWPGQWRIEVYDSDPVAVRLLAPFLPRKSILMTMDDFYSPARVALAVSKAMPSVVLSRRPGAWEAIWNGVAGNKQKGTQGADGLKARLLEAATVLAAQPEVRRASVIAAYILDLCRTAKAVDSVESLDSYGMPRRLPDGRVVFRFGPVLESMSTTADRFTRNEVSEVLNSVPHKRKWIPLRSGARAEFWCFSPSDLAALQGVAREPEADETTQLPI